MFNGISDYITVNISSPNTEDLRNFHDQKKLDDLLKLIERQKKDLNSKIPIVVKVSPDINDQDIPKVLNKNFNISIKKRRHFPSLLNLIHVLLIFHCTYSKRDIQWAPTQCSC